MSLFGDDDILEDSKEITASETTESQILGDPQSMDFCLGHDTQEKLFIDLFEKNNLPHAMIFSGLEGIGKTTMAFRLARFLLKNGIDNNGSDGLFGEDLPQEVTSLDVASDNPVFRRVASGGHADLLYIKRDFDQAKGKQAAALKVESLRKIEPFLRKTSSEGGWRIVIVDDADTMTRSAQNTILKILEEPPEHTLIILISHRPGMLIPTIHSRAQKVPFTSPGIEVMTQILKEKGQNLSEQDTETLFEISNGSIGTALKFQENDALDILKDILDHLDNALNGNIQKLHEFSTTLSTPSQDKQYRMFVDILQWLMRKILFLKARGEKSLPDYLQSAVTQNIITNYPLERLLEICDSFKAHFERVEFSNLDRRDAVRSAFLMISQ